MTRARPINELAAGGKPSTWLPPGGLVEHIYLSKNLKLRHNHQHEEKNDRRVAQTDLTKLTPDTYTNSFQCSRYDECTTHNVQGNVTT